MRYFQNHYISSDAAPHSVGMTLEMQWSDGSDCKRFKKNVSWYEHEGKGEVGKSGKGEVSKEGAPSDWTRPIGAPSDWTGPDWWSQKDWAASSSDWA